MYLYMMRNIIDFFQKIAMASKVNVLANISTLVRAEYCKSVARVHSVKATFEICTLRRLP